MLSTLPETINGNISQISPLSENSPVSLAHLGSQIQSICSLHRKLCLKKAAESGSHVEEAERLQFYKKLLYSLLNKVFRCPAKQGREALLSALLLPDLP